MIAKTTRTEFDGSQGKLAAALELPAGKLRAYALFAHCFSCTKDIKAAREIARALRAEGYAVLRFDFTGLGGSEGDFANTNFTSNVEDLEKAADFLRREFEAPAIMIGHSLGGAATIVAAHAVPEAKGVAVIGAPAEAAHVLGHIAASRETIERDGEAEVKLAGRPFRIRKQFIDDLENERVLAAAAALAKPLLILHAPLDQTVGIENATRIFTAAKHPKSFVSLDTADHLLSDEKDAHYAAGVIAAWAARFVDAPALPAAPKSGDAAPETRGGAVALTMPSRRYATALNIDGHDMIIDADAKDGGDGLGPNPSRVVEGALAACAAITMRMYAERKGWPLARARVTVRRAPGEDAHEAHVLDKEVALEGDLDDAQRARIREIGDRCPVHRMLSAGVTIRSKAG